MVFSSIPAYLDPSNWQQHPNHQAGNSNANPLQLQPSQQQQPPPPPVQPPPVGSIRPGSMAERARLANIPLPETALKCPRCESSNTKFCYFNNYSLTQPRHFCKACRRYWTRGGALRKVPVGGCCRRNKRTKSTASSKSPVSSSDRQTASSSTSSTAVSSNNSTAGPQPNISGILGLTTPQIPPLRFLSPLSHHQFADHYGAGDISYGGISSSAPVVGTSEMSFHMGPNFLGGGLAASLLSGGGGMEQWRLPQQLPFLGGLQSSSPGLYQLQTSAEAAGFRGGGDTSSHHLMRPTISTSMLIQLASVKMEDNQEWNLSRQLLGINPGNDQWSNTASVNWTDLTSFSSSSTTTPL